MLMIQRKLKSGKTDMLCRHHEACPRHPSLYLDSIGHLSFPSSSFPFPLRNIPFICGLYF